MVQVSVIVHDGQGRPVRGLTRQDFRLLDNGVEQEIRSFITGKSGVRQSQLAPGVFSNRSAEPYSVTVIVLDQLNCLFEDEAYGRSELLKFLRTVEAGHRIALLSLSSELKVLHELTTDALPI